MAGQEFAGLSDSKRRRWWSAWALDKAGRYPTRHVCFTLGNSVRDGSIEVVKDQAYGDISNAPAYMLTIDLTNTGVFQGSDSCSEQFLRWRSRDTLDFVSYMLI